MLHRAEEILVQTHRLIITGGRQSGLVNEPFALNDRVDELRVPGGQFKATDIQIPLLGDTRNTPVLTGQRGRPPAAPRSPPSRLPR